MSDAAPPALKKVSPLERELLLLVLNERLKPTEAIRQLVPSTPRPDLMASRMMARPHVKAERERMETDALATAGVTRAWIVTQLRKIASAKLFDDQGRLRSIDQLDEATREAVASVEYDEIAGGTEQLPLFDAQTGEVLTARKCKIKLWSKPDALKELATMAGLKEQDTESGVRIGPGLTVIVQQGVHVQGSTAQPSMHRVEVQLPRPR